MRIKSSFAHPILQSVAPLFVRENIDSSLFSCHCHWSDENLNKLISQIAVLPHIEHWAGRQVSTSLKQRGQVYHTLRRTKVVRAENVYIMLSRKCGFRTLRIWCCYMLYICYTYTQTVKLPLTDNSKQRTRFSTKRTFWIPDTSK